MASLEVLASPRAGTPPKKSRFADRHWPVDGL